MKAKINFACSNCLNVFDFDVQDIYFDKTGELNFVPLPKCPQCWATEEVVLSHFGMEQIDHMMFRNQIRTK